MSDRAVHRTIKALASAANRAEPGSPERARLTQSVDSAVMALIKRDEQRDADRRQREAASQEWWERWDLPAMFITGAPAILLLYWLFYMAVVSSP